MFTEVAPADGPVAADDRGVEGVHRHGRRPGPGDCACFGVDAVDFRLSYGDLITRFDHRTELFTDWVVPACAPALLARLDLTLNNPAPLTGLLFNLLQK